MARPTDDPKTFRLDLRFPPHMVEAVDEWRRTESDIPPRAEAIRRLVDRGLAYDGMYDVARKLARFSLRKIKKADLTAEEVSHFEELIGSYIYAVEILEDRLSKNLADTIEEVRSTDGSDVVNAVIEEVAKRRGIPLPPIDSRPSNAAPKRPRKG